MSSTLVSAGTGFPSNPAVGELRFDSNTQCFFFWTGTRWVAKTTEAVMNQWTLFLDDERSPDDVKLQSLKLGTGSIRIARSTQEAQQLVETHGLPTAVSLDFDLGGDDTAFKFLWWWVNGHMDDKWDLAQIESIQVHSANPEGAKKLISLWENFCRVKSIDTPIGRVWPSRKKR
jgi:hypothetical protein